MRTYLESQIVVPVVASRQNQFQNIIGKILRVPTALVEIFEAWVSNRGFVDRSLAISTLKNRIQEDGTCSRPHLVSALCSNCN